MTDLWRTVRQLAEERQCEDETVLAWIHSGDLAAIDISTRPGKTRPRWRISPEALRRFDETRTAKPPAPAPEPAPRTTRRRRDPAVREYF